MTSLSPTADQPLPKRLGQIPSPPAGLQMVLQLSNDPMVPLNQLAYSVCGEPSLAVELLRTANSAYYRTVEPVRSAQQAVAMMGVRSVRNHAVAHVLRSVASRIDIGAFDADGFWEDSLTRATAALVLGRQAGCEDPWEAFTTGLIQDSGLLMMAALWPEHSAELESARHLAADERMAIERQLCGLAHPALFECVTAEWNLPEELRSAVALHHDLERPAPSRRVDRLREIAHGADRLADLMAQPDCPQRLAAAHAAIQGLPSRSALDLAALVQALEAEMPNLAEQFQLPYSGDREATATVTDAIASLVNITSQYEDATRELEGLLEERQRLARALKATNNQLKQMATTDDLTEVSNRRHFFQLLGDALRVAEATDQPTSVVMLDIDSFKSINDTHGHAAGDHVLRSVAQRLKHLIRPSDGVGRLGGEEFALILPHTSRADAERVAHRALVAIRNPDVTLPDGTRLPVRASFGGATCVAGTDPEALVADADRAMYDAKHNGGDHVRWTEEAP